MIKWIRSVHPGLFLLQIPGLLMYGWFLKTGHLAGHSFRILSLLEFLGAVGLVFLLPHIRYFLFAFAIVAFPRAFSIIIGHDSHNMLFPLFAGMALGLYLRFLIPFYDKKKGFIPPAECRGPDHKYDYLIYNLIIFYIFISVLMVRAFLDSYSPRILAGEPLRDLQVSPGVSSNYAVYLALLFGLNLLGPLQFIIADLSLRRASSLRVSGPAITRGLLSGFGLATLFSLTAVAGEQMGWMRLFAGSALSYASGRMPALFTDSGSSSMLLPLAIYLTTLWLLESYKRYEIFQYDGRGIIYKIIFVFPLATLFWSSLLEGRAFFLVLFSLLLYIAFSQILEKRKQPHAERETRRKRGHLPGIVFLLFAVILMGAGVWIVLPYSAAAIRLVRTVPETFSLAFRRGFYEAYLNLDPPRALLFRAGLTIFAKFPWIGSGANSFMVQTAFLRGSIPHLPLDNPSTLILGLLGDTGLIGFGVFMIVFIIYVRGYIFSYANSEPILSRLFGAPLVLIPGFLVGYHFIFSEFAPFLLFPFLFLPASAGTDRTLEPSRRSDFFEKAMSYAIVFLLILYIALYVLKSSMN